MKRKIIIDCDPGHDDAVAILLAANNPEIEILGLSISSGNQTVDKTAINAMNICEFIGLDVPVSIGSKRPLIKEPMICPEIHGETGLDGFTFPKIKRSFDQRTGSELIVDLISTNDDVTIITTGPMTNLALALSYKPEIIPKIKEIIFMGGSIDHGNVSPAAEFNILVDPESSHIVLNSGVPLKMIGLNVTRQVLIDEEMIKRFRLLNNKVSNMFCDLMQVFLNNQKKTFGIDAAPLHDPLTVASFIDASIVQFQKMNVEIDLSHGSSYGRTNCDVFDYLNKEKNVDVAIGVDQGKFWNLLKNCLKKYQ